MLPVVGVLNASLAEFDCLKHLALVLEVLGTVEHGLLGVLLVCCAVEQGQRRRRRRNSNPSLLVGSK